MEYLSTHRRRSHAAIGRVTRYMGQTRISLHERSLRKFRDRVREITARKRGQSRMALR